VKILEQNFIPLILGEILQTSSKLIQIIYLSTRRIFQRKKLSKYDVGLDKLTQVRKINGKQTTIVKMQEQDKSV